MLYFSEISGKDVFTEDGLPIGKLDDLIFIARETPRITKIVVKKTDGFLRIPIEFVLHFNGRLTIAKNFTNTEIGENELHVMRNILDKQIIDLKGNKIVRVNDVVLQDKPTMYIAGVDIGFIGILRRLGLEKAFYRLTNFTMIKYNTQFLSWADIQPLELTRGSVKLNIKQEKLNSLHPADLADHLEKTNIKNITRIIDLLDKDMVPQVISELNPNYQIYLFKRLGNEKAAKIIEHMDPDEATDVMSQFGEKRRSQIMSLLSPPMKTEIERLMKLGNTTIGRYLNPEFFTVKVGELAGTVIERIRKETADLSDFNYIYVINDDKQLIGIFNLHELLMQTPDTPIFRFMIQNVIVCHLNSSAATVLRKLIKYHFYELPVIDSKKVMIGVIKRDDLADKIIDTVDLNGL